MKSNNNVNVNIKQDGRKDTVFSHVSNLFFDKIANAKWSKIIKVYIVSFIFLATFVILYFGYRAASDNEIVKNAALKMSQSEENIRDFVVTPKIQHELECWYILLMLIGHSYLNYITARKTLVVFHLGLLI